MNQMTWQPVGLSNHLILHLRQNPQEDFKPYTDPIFAGIAIASSTDGSGWATFRQLLSKGWTVYPRISDEF